MATLKIIEAMTLRDGGTTCVSIDDAGRIKHVTIDHQLPWDGRTRYVFVADRQFGRNDSERLQPNSNEERQLIREIRKSAELQLGTEISGIFIDGSEENPGQGMWFYVVNFLRIAAAERDAS